MDGRVRSITPKPARCTRLIMALSGLCQLIMRHWMSVRQSRWVKRVSNRKDLCRVVSQFCDVNSLTTHLNRTTTESVGFRPTRRFLSTFRISWVVRKRLLRIDRNYARDPVSQPGPLAANFALHAQPPRDYYLFTICHNFCRIYPVNTQYGLLTLHAHLRLTLLKSCWKQISMSLMLEGSFGSPIYLDAV